jgi:iron complex outermembrane receptor protein
MTPPLAFTKRRNFAASLLGSTVAALLVLPPCPLHGQAIDYGALEQLFKEPVTTSVTGSPQRVSEVPATMEIVTADDIRRSGAKDIPGVLRHLGGLDTLEWSNDNVDVGIRGYNQAFSGRLLVLVDGRQVYQDDYGETQWNSVPVELDMIRQIEVVKGPGSALFGFNAVSGVINIITWNPFYDTVNKVSATQGTQALTQGSAVATHKYGNNMAVRLSIGGSSDSDFATPIPASAANALPLHQYRAAINLDTVFRIRDKTLLTVEATRSDSQLNEMAVDYRYYNVVEAATSVKGDLTAESRYGLLQATAYTNWLRVRGSPGIANHDLRTNNRLTVAQLQDILKLGEHHTLRVSTEYRYTVQNTTPTTGGNVDEELVAFSGMWRWAITPTISLTNALRVDHLQLGRTGYVPPGYPFINSDWNRSHTPLSFNSGLVWKPNDASSIRIMVGRGTELPNLAVSGSLLVVGPGFGVTGIPFLQPTVVTNYEIGGDRVIAGPQILLRGSAFHQRNEDIDGINSAVIQTAGGPYFSPRDIGNSNANGVVLELKNAFPQYYRWSVDYRIERIEDHFISLAPGLTTTDFQHTTPVHLVKANLGLANKRWESDLYLNYQSEAYGIQTGGLLGLGSILTPKPIPAFAALDARIAYKTPDWLTWSISGQNLTQASQRQTAGRAVERRVLGTISIRF